jgi:3D (Asp-Asp-Asp) domain-containing protein
LAAFIALALSACESAGPTRSARSLPAYEAPVAKAEFQSVRTTAYTHTESDHREYSNRNALGGALQAASAPIRRAENTARALPVDLAEQSDYQRVAYSSTKSQTVIRKGKKVVVKSKPPKVGSAAADWSRWPAGTTFRVISTGQIYKVDDYGWALSGRNTIDLYMATPREMNSWGVRQEPIQVLRWGDRQESIRLLAPRQNHQHIKRMILELQGQDQEAASLR